MNNVFYALLMIKISFQNVIIYIVNNVLINGYQSKNNVHFVNNIQINLNYLIFYLMIIHSIILNIISEKIDHLTFNYIMIYKYMLLYK